VFKTRKGLDVIGKIKPSYEIKELNLTVNASLNTENTGSMGLNFNHLGVENSELEVSLTQSIADKKISTDFEGNWSYQNGPIGVYLGGTANLEGSNKPSFNGALVLEKPNNIFWTVGTEYGEVDNAMGISKYNAKLTYVTPNSEALFGVNYKKESDKFTYKTSWFQRLSSRLNYGVNFTTKIGEKNGFQTSAVVVGEYQVDEHTTLRAKTTTKAAENKVYPNLRIGFGISQRLSEGVTATIGADLNARHLFGSGPEGPPHSLGFEVNLF